MDQKELERLAEMLGAGADAEVDVDRVVDGVLRRLRVERRVVAWWRRPPALMAAAVAALLVGVGLLIEGGGTTDRRFVSDPAVSIAVFDELSAVELDQVLDSLTRDAPVYQTVTAGLDDLDESQLRELLALMEG